MEGKGGEDGREGGREGGNWETYYYLLNCNLEVEIRNWLAGIVRKGDYHMYFLIPCIPAGGEINTY